MNLSRTVLTFTHTQAECSLGIHEVVKCLSCLDVAPGHPLYLCTVVLLYCRVIIVWGRNMVAGWAEATLHKNSGGALMYMPKPDRFHARAAENLTIMRCWVLIRHVSQILCFVCTPYYVPTYLP
jgi:hypothetical protein